MTRPQLAVVCLLPLAVCLVPAVALDACPSYLEASWPQLAGLVGHQRSQLQLFAFDKQLANSWRRLPLQIDPRQPDQRLAFFPSEASWQEEPLSATDRLVMRREHFGHSKKPPRHPWPCPAKAVLSLSDPAAPGRLAYLLACSPQASPQPPKKGGLPAQGPVVYGAKEQLLYSHHYSYQFRPDNHMLFAQIALGQGAQRQLSAFQSEILIYAAVNRLLKLRFSARDIVSRIESIAIGPLGINARVSFYLKILFLKIKLSLSTDVSFYADSAHIPMVLFLPVAASSYLKPESGVFYSWQLARPYLQKPPRLAMPQLTPRSANLLRQGKHQALQSEALSHCPADNNASCLFQYELSEAAGLSMQLQIPASLVSKGFFPYFVAQPAAVSAALGWSSEEAASSPEVAPDQHQGLFFATAGLDQGAHAWDFWLHLSSAGQLGGACPAPLNVNQMPAQ